MPSLEAILLDYVDLLLSIVIQISFMYEYEENCKIRGDYDPRLYVVATSIKCCVLRVCIYRVKSGICEGYPQGVMALYHLSLFLFGRLILKSVLRENIWWYILIAIVYFVKIG